MDNSDNIVFEMVEEICRETGADYQNGLEAEEIEEIERLRKIVCDIDSPANSCYYTST